MARKPNTDPVIDLVAGADGVHRPAGTSGHGPQVAPQAQAAPQNQPASGFWSRMPTFSERWLVVSVASVLLTMVIAFLANTLISEKLNVNQISQAETYVRIAELDNREAQLRAASAALVRASRNPVVPEQEVVDILSFDCSDAAKQESGFADARHQVVTAGKSYRISQGCSLLVFEGRVKSLTAHKYLFQKKHKEGYLGCGDFGFSSPDVSYTPQQCADFINRSRAEGHVLQVIIQDGGFININKE